MDNEKEISFGAFDSELMHQEIYIPEGFEATIDGNKIILTKIESEDERIRKSLISYLHGLGEFDYPDKKTYHDWLEWLEKQGKKTIPKNVDDAALQYVDTCTVDGEVTHNNITEPYWNYRSMMNAYKAGWLKKQHNESVNIDIESMVSSYEQRIVSQYNGVRNNPFVNMCVGAFKHGIENTLEELNLKK